MLAMFGFVIKKAFFDLWDNFLGALILNVGAIALATLPALGPSATAAMPPLVSLSVFVFGVLVMYAYASGVFAVARANTDYRASEWTVFWTGLREQWRTLVGVGGLMLAHGALVLVAVPVYLNMGNLIALFALAMIFWLSVLWLLAVQYVPAAVTRLSGNLGSLLKKSFVLVFDNTLFSVGVALGALVILLVSVFTAFLFPGIAGLAIWYHTALKLRLLKYDFIEANPQADRKRVPWDELLYEERERVGTRTLRGMIFPCKE